MWNEDIVAKATGATVQGRWQAARVCIDSRNVESGDLFVAIKGERFDGHEYVAEALSKGASAALVTHIPSGCDSKSPLAIVTDTIKALTDMAVYNRARSSAVLIGVTGSVGKTGTKDALKLAFSRHGNVFATAGNFNNHIGLPLNLANMQLDTQYGIFEMGMNHAGEISFLTRLVRPHIAIITTVDAVHLEFFESVEGIADAKAEIMEGLPKNGTIILNRDNRYFARLREHAKRHDIKNILSFGEHESSDVRLLKYTPTKAGCTVQARINQKDLSFTLGTIGRHYAITSLMVLATASASEVNIQSTADALSTFSEPEGRGKFYSLAVPSGAGEYTLIDDCYNASPASMEAALAKLKELSDGLNLGGRKIAVLGDMLELGAASVDLHKGLAPAISFAAVDAVYACGPFMKNLYDTLPDKVKGFYAENSESLLLSVQQAIRPGDVVLIKGSNGSKMKLIRDALRTTPLTKDFAHAV